jgi:hypothetical protein
MRASAPRRGPALSLPAQVRHRAAALRRLGQCHDRGALHVREHRQPASADGKPEIATAPAASTIACPACCTGGKSQPETVPCPDGARSHADSTPSVMRGKGGTFFLVSPLRVSSRGPAGADGPEGLFDAEVGIRTDVRPACCCTLLLYLPRTLGSGFRITPLTCGAMGIRTPDLLHAISRQHVHQSM